MTDKKDLKKIKEKLDNYKPGKDNKDAKKMTKSILKSLGIEEGEFKDEDGNVVEWLEYENGWVYVGEVKDGKGTPNHTGQHHNHMGVWKLCDCKKHGIGTLTYGDGIKYDGEWKDDERHGSGTYTWPDGEKYDGEWKDGKVDGKGTYTRSDGSKYEGEFKDGEIHGRGTRTYSDVGKYEGEWKDGERHGRGVHTSPDGSKYDGEWKDGKVDGKGTCTYSDGTRYEGEWKENNPWTGTITNADGSKTEWKDGEEI